MVTRRQFLQGQPFKGLARWHGGEVRLDVSRPIMLFGETPGSAFAAVGSWFLPGFVHAARVSKCQQYSREVQESSFGVVCLKDMWWGSISFLEIGARRIQSSVGPTLGNAKNKLHGSISAQSWKEQNSRLAYKLQELRGKEIHAQTQQSAWRTLL